MTQKTLLQEFDPDVDDGQHHADATDRLLAKAIAIDYRKTPPVPSPRVVRLVEELASLEPPEEVSNLTTRIIREVEVVTWEKALAYYRENPPS